MLLLFGIFLYYNYLFLQRKEKLLKKQHRQALLLDSMMNIDGFTAGRSLRGRKPVTYSFGRWNAVEISHVSFISST